MKLFNELNPTDIIFEKPIRKGTETVFMYSPVKDLVLFQLGPMEVNIFNKNIACFKLDQSFKVMYDELEKYVIDYVSNKSKEWFSKELSTDIVNNMFLRYTKETENGVLFKSFNNSNENGITGTVIGVFVIDGIFFKSKNCYLDLKCIKCFRPDPLSFMDNVIDDESNEINWNENEVIVVNTLDPLDTQDTLVVSEIVNEVVVPLDSLDPLNTLIIDEVKPESNNDTETDNINESISKIKIEIAKAVQVEDYERAEKLSKIIRTLLFKN